MKGSIVFIVYAVALSVAAEDYTCTENPSTVVFYSNTLTCPDGLICNTKYSKVGNAKPKLCVAPSAICEYICDDKDDSKVIINGVSFTCDTGKQCNSQKTSCEVCVAKPCDESAYSCVIDDSTQFIMLGMTLKCPVAGEVCNKDYKQPCSACINETDPIAPTSKKARNVFYRSNYA